MGVLPERRPAEHDHAAPNRRIAGLDSLPRRWPVLEKALHDRPILIRNVLEAPGVFVGPVPGSGENCVEHRCYGRGACRHDCGFVGYGAPARVSLLR